jgi:predicted DNA-binding protein (MmcQ/YjbR family)
MTTKTLACFDTICRRLHGVTFVVQWGGSHVYKIGGKVFAIGNLLNAPSYIFKTMPLSFEILLEQGLATRAPYLRRGNWVMVSGNAMSEADLDSYIKQSYGIIAAKLPKAMRHELGLP